MVEAAGVEPASEKESISSSTYIFVFYKAKHGEKTKNTRISPLKSTINFLGRKLKVSH